MNRIRSWRARRGAFARVEAQARLRMALMTGSLVVVAQFLFALSKAAH